MDQLPIAVTDAERERQSYEDQVAIMSHARRLHIISGLDFALEVLASVVRAITSNSTLSDPDRLH